MVQKRVLALQHIELDPPGYLGELLQEHSIPYDVVMVQEGTLPDPTAYGAILSLAGPWHAGVVLARGLLECCWRGGAVGGDGGWSRTGLPLQAPGVWTAVSHRIDAGPAGYVGTASSLARPDHRASGPCSIRRHRARGTRSLSPVP